MFVFEQKQLTSHILKIQHPFLSPRRGLPPFSASPKQSPKEAYPPFTLAIRQPAIAPASFLICPPAVFSPVATCLPPASTPEFPTPFGNSRGREKKQSSSCSPSLLSSKLHQSLLGSPDLLLRSWKLRFGKQVAQLQALLHQ